MFFPGWEQLHLEMLQLKSHAAENISYHPQSHPATRLNGACQDMTSLVAAGWRSHGTANWEAALKKSSEAVQNIPGFTGFQSLKVPPCYVGHVRQFFSEKNWSPKLGSCCLTLKSNVFSYQTSYFLRVGCDRKCLHAAEVVRTPKYLQGSRMGELGQFTGESVLTAQNFPPTPFPSPAWEGLGPGCHPSFPALCQLSSVS